MGGDHPAALRDGCDVDQRAVGEAGGHDRLLDGLIGGGSDIEGAGSTGYAVADLVHVQEAPDETGGHDADELRVHVELLGHGLLHRIHVLDPAMTGQRIGVAAVDDDGLQLGGVLLHHHLDRGGLDVVAGERAVRCRRHLRVQQAHVQRAVLHSAVDSCRLEPLGGRDPTVDDLYHCIILLGRGNRGRPPRPDSTSGSCTVPPARTLP